jgi:acetyl-CoA carboxylase carboxyltransferase component
VLSLHAVGRIFQVMTQASGKIPQISVVLGRPPVALPTDPRSPTW